MSIKQWLTSIFFLCLHSAYSQTPTIPQLRLQLGQAKHDTVRLRLYVALTGLYRDYPASDSAYKMAQKGIALARQYKLPIAESTLLLHLGYYYKRQGHYAKAQATYQTAIRLQAKTGDLHLRGALLYGLACVYGDQSMFSNAIEATSSLLAIAEQGRDTSQLCRAYQLLALIHSNVHNKKLAFVYGQQQYRLTQQFIARHPEKKLDLVISETLIADLYEANGAYKQAYPYLKKTFDYFAAHNEKTQWEEAGWRVARSLVQQKRASDALHFLDESITRKLLRPNVAEISEVYALAHEQLGHRAQALTFARKAYRLSLINSPAKQIQSTLHTLIHVEESQKRYPGALAHLYQLTAINDSLFTLQKSQAIAEVEATYQFRQQQQTIELLRKDAALRKISLDRNRNELNVQRRGQLLLILFILLLLLGLAGLFIIVRRERTLGRLLIAQKAEIEDKANQLEESNTLKNKLFSIIGHDLRSPIASLKTQLMGVQEGYISPSAFKERTGKLTQMVDNVYLTLDNLLHWSMLQRDNLLTRTDELELGELAESVLRLYGSELQQKRLRLKTHLTPTPVKADELQVQIVVRNLLHNAIKFTPPGGTLTIATGRQAGQAWLSIADTGVGMALVPAEAGWRPLIPGRGTAGEKGTGLGLELCREFMRLNQGQLTIASEPGKGSTVTIHFGH